MAEEHHNRITNPAFREGFLEALGYKVDDLSLEQKNAIIEDVEKNWYFCGGRDTKPDSETPCPYDTKAWKRLWEHHFGNKPMPDSCEYCVCRQDGLRYNLFITDGQRTVTIGSVCMYQFLPRIASQVKAKHCDRCMKTHKNRKDNYCKDCRIWWKKEEERRVQAEYEQSLRNEQERQALITRLRQEEKQKEEERRARLCECGCIKQPQFPVCYLCHQKKERERQERVSQMTPQQKKAFICSCGKPKKPQFMTCWGCRED